jgi:hypothetical protein
LSAAHTIGSDEARAVLNDLIRQRERASFDQPDSEFLEANRLGIVYWQLQLARALSAEHREASNAA